MCIHTYIAYKIANGQDGQGFKGKKKTPGGRWHTPLIPAPQVGGSGLKREFQESQGFTVTPCL